MTSAVEVTTRPCALTWCVALVDERHSDLCCAVHRMPEFRELRPKLLDANEEIVGFYAAWCSACRGSGWCEHRRPTDPAHKFCSHDYLCPGRCRRCGGTGSPGIRRKEAA